MNSSNKIFAAPQEKLIVSGHPNLIFKIKIYLNAKKFGKIVLHVPEAKGKKNCGSNLPHIKETVLGKELLFFSLSSRLCLLYEKYHFLHRRIIGVNKF